MKKFLKFAAIAAAAFALLSCEKEPQKDDTQTPDVPETPAYTENLEFTLNVVDVKTTEAQISVKHNGTTKDTWYGFVTTTADVEAAIKAELDKITSSGKVSLKKNTSTTITLKDLEPETEYTYIAFALTSAGERYGKAGSIKFTTKRDANTLEETDDWKITYRRGEKDGQKVEFFDIACAEGKGFYFSYIDKFTLEMNKMSVADYVKYVISTEVPNYLKMDITWAELYIPGPETIYFSRIYSDDYIAVAVGYNADGTHTGYYSSQEFTVVQEEATPEFEKWVGTWTLTSAPYEFEGNTIQNSFNITILPIDNNFQYAMTGWECGENQYNSMDKIFGDIYVPLSYSNGMIGFEETLLTYIAADGVSEGSDLAFGLWGNSDVTYNGEVYTDQTLGFEGLTMAYAEMGEDGTGSIKGLEYDLTTMLGNGYEYLKYTGMGYIGIPMSQNVEWVVYNDYMRFPVTMVKVEDEPVPTAMHRNGNKNLRLSGDHKIKSPKKGSKIQPIRTL